MTLTVGQIVTVAKPFVSNGLRFEVPASGTVVSVGASPTYRFQLAPGIAVHLTLTVAQAAAGCIVPSIGWGPAA